jgi:eukaryotic-like serine/threonine-protein kinase
MASHAGSSTGPLNVGEIFIKWEIRGLLGKGGHAWVYQGYDAFLDRHVAIKIIPSPSESGPGRDLRQRAQLEARVLSKLENENVVRLIDAGSTSDGAVYIVMEILRGRTLREVIHVFGRLNVVEALLVGAKIADGVRAAHGVNVIHRDLKPENVFVIESNGVKVLDFGIAKLFGQGAATTQKELLHGTMKYMSPEHLLGLGVSKRSDIYALGTILYEALCGCIPCMLGMSEPSSNAVSYAQINQVPPPLDELVPSVPRFVARTIHRMLAKDPQDRFAEMAEVAELLRAHLERYLRESNATAPAARELWRAAPQDVSAAVLSHATTEVRELSELAPPTAPPVTLPTPQGPDTTPVSKPPFSQPASPSTVLNSQVTEPIRIVAAAARPPAPAAAPPSRVEPPHAPPPAMTSAAQASVPLSQAALRAPPSAPQAPPGSRSRVPNAAPNPPQRNEPAQRAQAPGRPRSTQREVAASWNLLTIGIPLGAAMGLIVGLAAYRHPPSPTRAQAPSAEEAIVVVSRQPPSPAEPPPHIDPIPPTPTVTPTALAVAPTPSSTPPTAAATQVTSRPPAPKAPVVAPPAPPAHALAKPATKPPTAMPASGLWDMSDLDAPTKPKPAPSTFSKSLHQSVY